MLIAVGLVVAASFGFAGGAVMQHMAVSSHQKPGQRRVMTLRQVRALLFEPRWLLGLLLLTVGVALHVVALSMAPVTVVQPVGILAVPWAVLLAARIYGYRSSVPVWLAVSVTIAGVVGLTVLSMRFSDDAQASMELSAVLLAIVVCGGIGGTLAAVSHTVPEVFRSLALAGGGAVLFGLTSALVKSLFVALRAGAHPLSPEITVSSLGVLVTCVIGSWMIQQAYAVGYPEIVVGALTTIDPVVAVAYGLLVLGEGVAISVPVVVAMVSFGVVAVLGVAALTRYHPATQRHVQTACASVGRG